MATLTFPPTICTGIDTSKDLEHITCVLELAIEHNMELWNVVWRCKLM